MAGYVLSRVRLTTSWSAVSDTLKVNETSRNRRFSVGTNPSRKILIPSRTLKGMVTTPYTPGTLDQDQNQPVATEQAVERRQRRTYP